MKIIKAIILIYILTSTFIYSKEIAIVDTNSVIIYSNFWNTTEMPTTLKERKERYLEVVEITSNKLKQNIYKQILKAQEIKNSIKNFDFAIVVEFVTEGKLNQIGFTYLQEIMYINGKYYKFDWNLFIFIYLRLPNEVKKTFERYLVFWEIFE